MNSKLVNDFIAEFYIAIKLYSTAGQVGGEMKYSSCDERNALTFFNMAVLLVLHCDKEKLLRAVVAPISWMVGQIDIHIPDSRVESDLGFRVILGSCYKVPLHFASVGTVPPSIPQAVKAPSRKPICMGQKLPVIQLNRWGTKARSFE